MRIKRMMVDLSRLELLELESLPKLGSNVRKHGFALADYLSIELANGADGLPACIADDLGVFGCIIGESELLGGAAVRALKVDFADRDVGHVASG
jgi:hypothetical protein